MFSSLVDRQGRGLLLWIYECVRVVALRFVCVDGNGTFDDAMKTCDDVTELAGT